MKATSFGASWAVSVETDSPISCHVINAMMVVVAASQGGDIVAESLASDSVVDSTDVTGQLINKVDHMY